MNYVTAEAELAEIEAKAGQSEYVISLATVKVITCAKLVDDKE